MRSLLTAATVLACVLLTSACNTTIGFGRDLRILGESMESQAQRSRGSDTDHGGAPVY